MRMGWAGDGGWGMAECGGGLGSGGGDAGGGMWWLEGVVGVVLGMGRENMVGERGCYGRNRFGSDLQREWVGCLAIFFV